MSLTLGVIGVDHRHIYGQLAQMLARGCSCKGWVDRRHATADGRVRETLP